MAWDDRSGRIDHESADYVFQQIADDIRADIESGALPGGAKLPSGPELADIYGVSKDTASSAVRALRDEGLVRIVRSKGTFVTRKD